MTTEQRAVSVDIAEFISGYDEVMYVLKNPKLFSNSGYANSRTSQSSS